MDLYFVEHVHADRFFSFVFWLVRQSATQNHSAPAFKGPYYREVMDLYFVEHVPADLLFSFVFWSLIEVEADLGLPGPCHVPCTRMC